MVPYYSSNPWQVWTIEHDAIKINLDKTSLRRSPPCSFDGTAPKLQFCSPCGYLVLRQHGSCLFCHLMKWTGLNVQPDFILLTPNTTSRKCKLLQGHSFLNHPWQQLLHTWEPNFMPETLWYLISPHHIQLRTWPQSVLCIFHINLDTWRKIEF